MGEHYIGVSGGEATWLHEEVEEDGIRLPVTEGLDGSLVDSHDKEGGGSTGLEAVGFNAVRWDVGDVVNGPSDAP